MTKALVSICCSSYNHAKFIRQCLDSFLMQETTFDFEILIHDDASNDGTQEIIKEYQARYPQIIKPYFQTTNQFPTAKINLPVVYNYNRVQGKYVALCEGDDFWTDPKKLQKQVDFLEAHPDHAICFHLVKVFYEDASKEDSYFPSPEARKYKASLDLDEIIYKNFIQTNSVLYRWRFHNENIIDYYPNFILPGDWYLHILHAQTGKIGYLDECMSAYRKHSGGIWWNVSRNIDKHYLQIGIRELNFRLALHYKIYQEKNADHFQQVRLYADYLLLLFYRYQNLKKLNNLLENYGQYLTPNAVNELALNAQHIGLTLKIQENKKLDLYQADNFFAHLDLNIEQFMNLSLSKIQELQKELQTESEKSQKLSQELNNFKINYNILEKCTKLLIKKTIAK